YWNTLWQFYADGGFGYVAAYLTEFNLSGFDPKAPPPKTPTFWEIVNVNTGGRRASGRDRLARRARSEQPQQKNPSRCIDGARIEPRRTRRDRRVDGNPRQPPLAPTSARALRLHRNP